MLNNSCVSFSSLISFRVIYSRPCLGFVRLVCSSPPVFSPSFLFSPWLVGAELGHGSLVLFPWASFGQWSQRMWHCCCRFMLGFDPLLYDYMLFHICLIITCCLRECTLLFVSCYHRVFPWLLPKIQNIVSSLPLSHLFAYVARPICSCYPVVLEWLVSLIGITARACNIV